MNYKMFKYIDENKLKDVIKERDPYVLVDDWAETAFELEKNNHIYEIKKLFRSLHREEVTEIKILAHLSMIFDELSDSKIQRFVTAQVDVRK